jgi:hypothetical protein
VVGAGIGSGPQNAAVTIAPSRKGQETKAEQTLNIADS